MRTHMSLTADADITAKLVETPEALNLVIGVFNNSFNITLTMTEAQGETLRDYIVACLGPGEPTNEPF